MAKQAKVTIESMLQSGTDKGTCADLAAATIKEVTDAVSSQQQILEALQTGAHCLKEGEEEVKAAQQTLANAEQAKKDAKGKLAEANAAPIQFAPTSMDNIEEGQCGNFFVDAAYAGAKKTYEDAETAVTAASGQITAAKKSCTEAQTAQQEAIQKCECDVRMNYNNAWKAATANNEANAKAFTKGKHMQCVLNGTPPA